MDNLLERLERARLHMDPQWTPEHVETVRSHMWQRAETRARRRRAWGGAAVVVAAVAGWSVWPSAPINRTLRFSDGSVATVLTDDTELVVRQVEPRQIAVDLDRGSAHFEVAPNPERRFQVACGSVSVTVLGTAFTLERDRDRTRVVVDHGSVRVEWDRHSVVLGPQGQGWFPTVPPTTTLPEEVPYLSPARPTRDRTRVSRGEQVEESPWRALAACGEFDAAYQELQKLPPTAVKDEPGDLLLAADVARLSGHPNDAVPPLERVINEYSADPRASLAAFTLGRVLLTQLGEPRKAALTFGRARTLAPQSSLAEDALAREVEAWSTAGDPERARECAEQYVEKYPRGWRIHAVRRFGGLK